MPTKRKVKEVAKLVCGSADQQPPEPPVLEVLISDAPPEPQSDAQSEPLEPLPQQPALEALVPDATPDATPEETEASRAAKCLNALLLWPDKVVNFDKKKTFKAAVSVLIAELDRIKVPLSCLAVLMILLLYAPKLLLLWVPLALIWSATEELHRRLPLPMQARVSKLIPEKVRDSYIVHELSEGIAQVRPFIMVSLYLFCVPLAMIMISGHWILKHCGFKLDPMFSVKTSDDHILLNFKKAKTDEEEESNFFHSPAFNVVTMLFVACGIPAAIAMLTYQHFGVDAALGLSGEDAAGVKEFLSSRLYLMGLGCCLAVLIIRGWFVFPFNFIDTGHTIELNARHLHRRMNGWVEQVLFWNCPWQGTDSIAWADMKTVRYENNKRPLYPLPLGPFEPNSLFYIVMNKLAAFADGITKQSEKPELLHFSTVADPNGCGSKITVNLSHLDGEQRARLFYAIRKFAPHLVVDEEAQGKLLGSGVMHAPQYTQLWFDLLTDDMLVKRAGLLNPGDTLRDGALTVERRLASGGQANIYEAVDADGKNVVLKEFILSTSDAVGALLESAGEFETETALLSILQHERIVRMHDFFAADRRLYIVLEKIDGSSLRQLVKGEHGVFSEDETITVALQVCDVLSYLHGQDLPIVHRDIAPDNIIFDEAAGAKVIDFSLAAAKKVRRTTSTMGKHSYAPPEQIREQPCPQSDIYALGATMYFLLTGEDPKPITVCDVQSKRPDISERLAQIIKHATAFELTDRYADVKWLKLDLEEL